MAVKVTVPGFSAVTLHLLPELEISTTSEAGSANSKETESSSETLLRYKVALLPFIRTCVSLFNLCVFFNTVTVQEVFAPPTEAVILAVPGVKPVITPSVFTDATFGLEDFHEIVPEGAEATFKRYVFSVYIVTDVALRAIV